MNEYLRTLEISAKTPDFWFFGKLEALARWDLFPRGSYARNQLSVIWSLRWGVSVRGREPVSRLSIRVCVDTRVYICPVTAIACSLFSSLIYSRVHLTDIYPMPSVCQRSGI